MASWARGVSGCRGSPGDAECSSVPSAGELYRASLRRQKFPAQGSIEIHEDGEVCWDFESAGPICGQDFRSSPRIVDRLPSLRLRLPCCVTLGSSLSLLGLQAPI